MSVDLMTTALILAMIWLVMEIGGKIARFISVVYATYEILKEEGELDDLLGP